MLRDSEDPRLPPLLVPEARMPSRIGAVERSIRRLDSGTSRRVPVVPFVGILSDRPTLLGQIGAHGDNLYFQGRTGAWYRVNLVAA